MARSFKQGSTSAAASSITKRGKKRHWVPRGRPLVWFVSSGILLLAIVGIWLATRSAASSMPIDLHAARYVGAAKCAECHADQVKQFTGSHHDLAMDHATPATVLGDFSGVEIEHLGVTSRMFRDGDKYMIATEGPDGAIQEFEIKYVFGVDPLQQYMVEFAGDQPVGENQLPRVQVLRVSWDTDKKQWFHLDPPDVDERLAPDDDLHWTGVTQRWNNMCAECHSTNYQKNFDVQSLSYQSTFTDIDVSCEACHGPGSKHIEMASQWMPGWSRQRGYGLADLKGTAEGQIQSCAPCHSRRSILAGGFRAGDNFYDYYADQLLTAGIYYPDGQVLDEDYIHGSFIQSKMYHKGIRCTDCHDPHTARLKAQGNQVCTSCHQHPQAKYDSVAHHHHQPGSAGAQCVNCHMPATTYMDVDERHDHSLRIPRPDLSLQIDTPNACAGCHLKSENVAQAKRPKLALYQDWMQAARDGDQEVKRELERANRWCDEACDKWYGATRRRDEHFGQAIAAGQQHAPDAAAKLGELLRKRPNEVPAIARATALRTLQQVDAGQAGRLAAVAVKDDHPLVRAAACDALSGHASRVQSASLLAGALDDPVRLVRTAAARNLLQYSQAELPASSAPRLRQAVSELAEAAKYDSDRSGAHMNLAIIAEQEGRQQAAIEHYRDAMRVEPRVTGPRTNLAALLERNLHSQSAAGADADSPIAREIQALREAELELLARDVKLLPDSAALQYRYGLALYAVGQKDAAMEHLWNAAQLEPTHYDYVQGIALLFKSRSRWDEAAQWAERLIKLAPEDPMPRQILKEIEQRVP